MTRAVECYQIHGSEHERLFVHIYQHKTPLYYSLSTSRNLNTYLNIDSFVFRARVLWPAKVSQFSVYEAVQYMFV